MAMAQVAVNDWHPQYGHHHVSPMLVSLGGSDSSLDGLQEEKAKLENISLQPKSSKSSSAQPRSSSEPSTNATHRLNKFVRRLHEMLTTEREGGIVEWRRGLLVLHSIDRFSKEVLPRYFNTRNFKTFRRQLNYYGFLHVRSFSASGSATTALWVNQELADNGSDCISSVLKLKRVEPNESSKTPEGRRVRKNEAASSVEVEGLGALLSGYSDNVNWPTTSEMMKPSTSDCPVPKVVHFQHEPPPLPSTYSKTSPHHDLAAPVVFAGHDNSNDPVIDHAAGLLLSLSRTG
ncbi:hypothetical protein ACHAXR_008295 [Thalassiosira sp. AJA248-18]